MKQTIQTSPGVYFTASATGITDSLFSPVEGRTAAGFYRRANGGIRFYDVAGNPFAFLVARGLFFVSCSREGGRIRYSFGISEVDSMKLGIHELSLSAQSELAEKLQTKTMKQTIRDHMNQDNQNQTSAHTPGPWSVVIEGHEAFILNNGDNAPQGITSIVLKGAGMNYSESLANARLIAAAPELLAACELVRYIEAAHDSGDWDDTDWTAIIGQMRAAIAAATGGDR